MTTHFTSSPLKTGVYEPEGIYLSAPFEGVWPIVQFWNDNQNFYKQFFYNGVRVKGHTGLDFKIAPEVRLLSVDGGRVVEISYEPGGFEQYIKLEHDWGESFYAHIGKITVEAGQKIKRDERIGYSQVAAKNLHLHFGLRILPYNRFDGWGGFTDPLPYLDTNCIVRENEPAVVSEDELPFMVIETKGRRRP